VAPYADRDSDWSVQLDSALSVHLIPAVGPARTAWLRRSVGAPIWTDPDLTRAACQIPGTPNVAVCAHPYQADAVYLAFRFGDPSVRTVQDDTTIRNQL